MTEKGSQIAKLHGMYLSWIGAAVCLGAGLYMGAQDVTGYGWLWFFAFCCGGKAFHLSDKV